MSLVDISYVSDSVIEWKPYKKGDDIVKRFSTEDWHKIASDVDSEEILQELFENHPDKIQGYVLYEVKNNTPIAFVYILKEYCRIKTVSYHGGGWGKSPRLTLLYMRGTILLIERLLKEGFKVRTYCNKDNHNAYKFMQGLGFVRYRTTEERIYQWINLRRLYNSNIYNYIFKRRLL